MIRVPITGQHVTPDPAESELFVRQLCRCVDFDFQEKWTPEEVVKLLDRAGYAISPYTLQEFQAKRYVAEALEWDATAIHCLAAGLDHRRRWKPAPNPLHDVFKSSARLTIERGMAEGHEPFPDHENYSVEDLLVALAITDHRAIREGLLEAVKHKMNQLGFVEE